MFYLGIFKYIGTNVLSYNLQNLPMDQERESDMMISGTLGGAGLWDIPDLQGRHMSDSLHDQCRQTGNNYSPARRESQIVFITGEMNGY
jgi:hypothetical protein